ncbi:hypothetical protein TSOC_000352 [Tetrabaena socialis]|uniref:Uncharacterized protein n=1 Tax=Tetrabaena socialis TaxID=47790 RepID=A0A2J8AJI1_9CHLO|nr:hypothetical protein TSOC_000352 [Tetrabaena socialis]|eukprot:PNH12670.1 hypothetical protein TSOC_000352 [Tetrabaena socialis]
MQLLAPGGVRHCLREDAGDDNFSTRAVEAERSIAQEPIPSTANATDKFESLVPCLTLFYQQVHLPEGRGPQCGGAGSCHSRCARAQPARESPAGSLSIGSPAPMPGRPHAVGGLLSLSSGGRGDDDGNDGSDDGGSGSYSARSSQGCSGCSSESDDESVGLEVLKWAQPGAATHRTVPSRLRCTTLRADQLVGRTLLLF